MLTACRARAGSKRSRSLSAGRTRRRSRRVEAGWLRQLLKGIPAPRFERGTVLANVWEDSGGPGDSPIRSLSRQTTRRDAAGHRQIDRCYTGSAMRTVVATRYVEPLREGGSLPALVEADDDGMYVLKFRGAGQGPKALVAELIAGEIARVLGLPIPEIVLVDVDPMLARAEPDPEIQDLIRKSEGLNLAMDFLPGALTFSDADVEFIGLERASQVVWFDAYVANVDRTVRNTNMLMWHDGLYLIDHGAALYFHHDWSTYERFARNEFSRICDHVLLRRANELVKVDREFRQLLTDEVLGQILSKVPGEWLETDTSLSDAVAYRTAYHRLLRERRDFSKLFLQEAVSCHDRIV